MIDPTLTPPVPQPPPVGNSYAQVLRRVAGIMAAAAGSDADRWQGQMLADSQALTELALRETMTDLFDGPHLRPPDPAKLAALRSRLNISKAILSGRLDKGWSQDDLARASGTTQARISRLEAMKENASLDTLDRVAKALGLTVALVPTVPLAPGAGKQ